MEIEKELLIMTAGDPFHLAAISFENFRNMFDSFPEMA